MNCWYTIKKKVMNFNFCYNNSTHNQNRINSMLGTSKPNIKSMLTSTKWEFDMGNECTKQHWWECHWTVIRY